MQKKKLLGSALALAMVFPSSQASAELLKNLKVDGQYDFAGVAADNVTDFATGPDLVGGGTANRDKIGSMQNRFLVGIGFDLLDDVHAKVTLSNNDRVYGNAAQSLQGLTDAVQLAESNLKIDKVFGAVDTTLGRQFYGNPGDLVAYYGPRNDYGLTTTALDSVRFDWAGEMMGLTAVFGKESANAAGLAGGAAIANDVDVRGLIASLKGHENLSAGAYVWNAMTRRYANAVGVPPQGLPAATVGGRNQRLYVAGLKGKLTMGGLWAGAEFAKNFGDQRQLDTATTAGSRKFTGWAFLADAGAKIDVDGIAAFTPWGQFGMGSGDENTRDNENAGFQAIATDYRPGAIYGRFHSGAGAGVLASAAALGAGNGIASQGLNNRVIVGLGVKATPAAASKLTVGASVWNFRTHRDTVQGSGATPANGEKELGSEIDLEANWAHSDNVGLTLTLARFMPGKVIHQAAQSTTAGAGSANSGQPVNAANMAAFDVKIKWGGQQ